MIFSSNEKTLTITDLPQLMKISVVVLGNIKKRSLKYCKTIDNVQKLQDIKLCQLKKM